MSTEQVHQSAGKGPLITAQELYDRMNAGEKVTVFDVRFNLSNKSQGRDAYFVGHLPNAYYLDLEHDLSDAALDHGGRHPLPSVDALTNKLRAAGVSSTTGIVVFYDDGGGMAARGWWLLRYLGHKRVYVLDGGFAAWVEGGFPIGVELPTVQTGDFEPSPDGNRVVSVSEVECIVRGDTSGILIDSRAGARYRGLVEPIDKAAGHIPTAVNKPWEEAVRENGTWKTANEQNERFADVLGKEKPIVVYCGSGVTACANLLALEIAGIQGAKLYPGSWSDWCSYPDHPIAQGEDK